MDWARFVTMKSERFPADTAANWSWVRFFAAEAWRYAADNGGTVETQRTVQLLAAVGNFKRQTPIAFDEAPAVEYATEDQIRLMVRGPEVSLFRDESRGSCSRLEELRGVRTATASAVLAGLWPDDHWIMDTRSAPALAGLLHAAEMLDEERPNGFKAAEVSAADYAGWYRPGIEQLSQTWGVSGQSLERCCFLMDAPPPDPNRSWDKYAELLMEQAAADLEL